MTDLDPEFLQRQDQQLAAQYGEDSPAAREFDRARRKVLLHDIMAFLRGYRNHLLDFGELSETLASGEPVDLGVQDVPLDAIRGSVDRYREFDLAFLPKHEGLRDRWQRVEAARRYGLPMRPVELYKLGDVYFVRDGHHRVSVARAHGDKTIQAHVLEITSRVPLHPDLKPNDLPDIRAYGDFLRVTRADEILPGVDLRLSEPRYYARLLRHIALFRYLNRKPGEKPREWPQAVRAWHEQLYRPICEMIRDSGVMAHFPKRTRTDLYLWITTHFRQLNQRLPRPDELDEIAKNLEDIYLAPFWNG
ncbi:MAG TPA: hypothetical protein G4O05_05255 [Caldilineae bacterium]|nr:hypothetical protein [Caldilineae bacterium]HIQ12019.1 hypothetical protein [Caldilineales bacterium]